MINTDGNVIINGVIFRIRPQGVSWEELSEARSRLMLHEVLHYFLGEHHPNNLTLPEANLGVADRGIMNVRFRTDKGFMYKTGTHVLDDEQIHVIQSKTRPAQNG